LRHSVETNTPTGHVGSCHRSSVCVATGGLVGQKLADIMYIINY